MNNVERNALSQLSDKGLLKATVNMGEVAVATSVKRATDVTWDQSINLGIVFFSFNQTFTYD